MILFVFKGQAWIITPLKFSSYFPPEEMTFFSLFPKVDSTAAAVSKDGLSIGPSAKGHRSPV